VRPVDKRELVTYVYTSHGLSIRRACQAFGLSRTVHSYQPSPSDDGLIIETLVSLAEQFPRYGFGKIFPLVRRQQPT
jgi:putative transposase